MCFPLGQELFQSKATLVILCSSDAPLGCAGASCSAPRAVKYKASWHGDILQGRQLGKFLRFQLFSLYLGLTNTSQNASQNYWILRGCVIQRDRFLSGKETRELLEPRNLGLFCFVSGKSIYSYYLSLLGREGLRKYFSLVPLNISNFHSCWMR